jgi:hypothetical protein
MALVTSKFGETFLLAAIPNGDDAPGLEVGRRRCRLRRGDSPAQRVVGDRLVAIGAHRRMPEHLRKRLVGMSEGGRVP